MTDPVAAACRRAVSDSFQVLRGAVEGLPAETLNRRPAGEETNSIAVLVTHALHATRFLMMVGLGLPVPARDRSAEFAVHDADATGLLTEIDLVGAEVLAMLDAADQVDWAAARGFTRADGSRAEFTAAWGVIHAVDHLRGHADEAALTRHVVAA